MAVSNDNCVFFKDDFCEFVFVLFGFVVTEKVKEKVKIPNYLEGSCAQVLNTSKRSCFSLLHRG